MFVADDTLADRPAPATHPDIAIQQREAGSIARRAAQQLADAVGALTPHDRLILRMRFEDGVSIADIARTLQLEQKPLYRRLEGLLSALRRALEHGGLTSEAAVEALEQGGFDPAAPDASPMEIWGDVRPIERSGRSSVTNAGGK